MFTGLMIIAGGFFFLFTLMFLLSLFESLQRKRWITQAEALIRLRKLVKDD